MTEPHYGISDKGISFVGSIGERVCRNAERAVNAVKSVGRSAKHNVGHSFAKVNKARKIKKAKEPAKRSPRQTAVEAANIIFPIASVAALAFTVNHFASQDYGVQVNYDGESLGVISGDDVLGEAQKVVADRVKYYDTNGGYYVNASLAITPLSSVSDVIDENDLAKAMEGRISSVYEEKSEEVPVEEEEESIEGKVKAFAVRVNGELIGAVVDSSPIEEALRNYMGTFDDGTYTDISFNKDVVYDLEEYVDPDQVVPYSDVIKILLGRVKSAEYYEVQDGDYLLKIAEDHGVTLEELSKCYATYNGQAIDLQGNMLKTGTMIQFAASEPYLDVELSKPVTYRSDIPFSTVTVEDPTLPVGKTVVEREGTNGEKRTRSLVTYRGGKVIRKKTLDTEIYEDPVPQIIRIGAPENYINHNVPQFKLGMGTGEYCWPVDGGYISAHIGDGRGHKGIDIAAPYGTPIYAAAAGTVVEASMGWSGGYGNVIKIQNDDGRFTVYGHQSELSAQVGDHVEMGQLIGYIGSTGDSTGNHLHFEVRENGMYLNPEEFVCQDNKPQIKYVSQPAKPDAGIVHKPIAFETTTAAATAAETVSETAEAVTSVSDTSSAAGETTAAETSVSDEISDTNSTDETVTSVTDETEPELEVTAAESEAVVITPETFNEDMLTETTAETTETDPADTSISIIETEPTSMTSPTEATSATTVTQVTTVTTNINDDD